MEKWTGKLLEISSLQAPSERYVGYCVWDQAPLPPSCREILLWVCVYVYVYMCMIVSVCVPIVTCVYIRKASQQESVTLQALCGSYADFKYGRMNREFRADIEWK